MAPKSNKFIASDDDLDDYENDDSYKKAKKSSTKAATKKSSTKKNKRKADSDDDDEDLDEDEDEEDDEDEAEMTASDSDEAPKAKKRKADKTSSSSSSSRGKKKAGNLLKNGEGDSYVLLGKNKRVTIRKYNQSKLIDIRETYDKDGKEGLPGKKGISLTPEMWSKLKESFADIDAAIAAL